MLANLKTQKIITERLRTVNQEMSLNQKIQNSKITFVRLSTLADLIIIMYVAIPPSHRRKGDIGSILGG